MKRKCLRSATRLAKRAMAAAAMVCTVPSAHGSTQVSNTIYSFAGGTTDGRQPAGSLLVSGNSLFGITTFGGASNDGIIYQYNLSTGTEKVLYSFAGSFGNPVDPSENYGSGSLIQSSNTLYGVSWEGGSVNGGTVFSYTLGATNDSILHSFVANGVDGMLPIGALVQSGTTLYGVTHTGGTAGGIFYSLNTTNNQETILHNWTGSTTDGATPGSGPIQLGSMLYGTTEAGGAAGTIYSYNTSNSAFKTLYTFNAANDGYSPYGSLTASGNLLYGLTVSGGLNSRGTLFQFNTATNTEQVLYNFNADAIGDDPMGSLIQSGAYLYGETSQDATNSSDGSVFAYNTQSGTMTLLADFTSGQPVGGLVMLGSNLYGVTNGGGTNSDGSIFSVPALPVPVPEPASALMIIAASSFAMLRRRRQVCNGCRIPG